MLQISIKPIIIGTKWGLNIHGLTNNLDLIPYKYVVNATIVTTTKRYVLIGIAFYQSVKEGKNLLIKNIKEN